MDSTSKIFALHYEPEDQWVTHFIDSKGNLLFKPCYNLEVPITHIVELINTIAQFPRELRYDWMCAPSFKDVLIWENSSGQVIQTFQICFSCDQYLSSSSHKGPVFVTDSQNDKFAEPIKALRTLFDKFDKKAHFDRAE